MSSKKILFRCCTFYQLINAINIKLTLLAEDEVDLILNSSSDFTPILSHIRESNIFRQVAIMGDSLMDNREFRALGKSEKLKWFHNLKENMMDFPFEEENYTDYYIAINDEYNTFVYYYLVEKGGNPNVHIFEESKATYVLSITQPGEKDGIPHAEYQEKNFYKNITEILLYEPDFFMAERKGWNLITIPKIDCSEKSIVEKYEKIFGTFSLPEQRYIFLVSPFFWDKFNTSEIDVIDIFANIVGKENMVLKLHPRDGIDRYTCRGYKVLDEIKIPWEVVMMSNKMDDHVLVSVFSNAAITADLILGKQIWTINLADLLYIGKEHKKLMQFSEFDKKISLHLNQEKKHLLKANNKDQLIEIVKYIERKMNGYENR